MKKFIALIGLCAFVSQCNAVQAADAVTKRERNGAPIRDYMEFQQQNEPCNYDSDRCKPAPRQRQRVAVTPPPAPPPPAITPPQVPVVGTVVGSTLQFVGNPIRAPFEGFAPPAVAAPQPVVAPAPPPEPPHERRVLRRSG